MRTLAIIFLSSALGVQAAPTVLVAVDLDKPGALEQLKRERPKHHAKVVAAMEEVQAVPISEQQQHRLRFDVEKSDPTRRHIETSDPAKTRMTILVEVTSYRITVEYTKQPAALSKAK